jgi:hypothetical protein
MPHYKVPEGMCIAGFLNKYGRFYHSYAWAAKYNARQHPGQWVDGQWCESPEPVQLPEAVYVYLPAVKES